MTEDSTPMKLDDLSGRVGRLEESMVENTTITRGMAAQLPELKDMLTVYTHARTTGTVLTKVVKWGGGVAAAIAAIYAAAASFLHLKP